MAKKPKHNFALGGGFNTKEDILELHIRVGQMTEDNLPPEVWAAIQEQISKAGSEKSDLSLKSRYYLSKFIMEQIALNHERLEEEWETEMLKERFKSDEDDED